MIDLPATIKHPETFANSPAAGFDGVFDWSWTQGCFGPGKITPMDFDGVVERRGNFIVFETKGVGVPIPDGQLFTLEAIHKLDVFTVVFIHGKTAPEELKVWCAPGFKSGVVMAEFKPATTEKAHDFVSDWYQYADKNPKRKVDHTMLNRRIQVITDERDALIEKITHAKALISQVSTILEL